MADQHSYCRFVLHLARREAKQDGVAVPKRLTAMRCDKRQFFVEGQGIAGEYVPACCAYEAKAVYLHQLTDKKGESK